MTIHQMFPKSSPVENYQILRLLQNVEGGLTDVVDLLFLLTFLGKLAGCEPVEIADWITEQVLPPDITLPYEDDVVDWYGSAQEVAAEAFGS